MILSFAFTNFKGHFSDSHVFCGTCSRVWMALIFLPQHYFQRSCGKQRCKVFLAGHANTENVYTSGRELRDLCSKYSTWRAVILRLMRVIPGHSPSLSRICLKKKGFFWLDVECSLKGIALFSKATKFFVFGERIFILPYAKIAWHRQRKTQCTCPFDFRSWSLSRAPDNGYFSAKEMDTSEPHWSWRREAHLLWKWKSGNLAKLICPFRMLFEKESHDKMVDSRFLPLWTVHDGGIRVPGWYEPQRWIAAAKFRHCIPTTEVPTKESGLVSQLGVEVSSAVLSCWCHLCGETDNHEPLLKKTESNQTRNFTHCHILVILRNISSELYCSKLPNRRPYLGHWQEDSHLLHHLCFLADTQQNNKRKQDFPFQQLVGVSVNDRLLNLT